MARSTFLLVVSVAAIISTVLAASNFPDCTSGPLANNSVCDTSLGEQVTKYPQGQEKVD